MSLRRATKYPSRTRKLGRPPLLRFSKKLTSTTIQNPNVLLSLIPLRNLETITKNPNVSTLPGCTSLSGLWRYTSELQLQAAIPRNFIGSLHIGHTSPAGLCHKLDWCRHPAEEWARARPPHLEAGKGRCSRRSLPPSRPRSLSVPQPIFQQCLLKPMGIPIPIFHPGAHLLLLPLESLPRLADVKSPSSPIPQRFYCSNTMDKSRDPDRLHQQAR